MVTPPGPRRPAKAPGPPHKHRKKKIKRKDLIAADSRKSKATKKKPPPNIKPPPALSPLTSKASNLLPPAVTPASQPPVAVNTND